VCSSDLGPCARLSIGLINVGPRPTTRQRLEAASRPILSLLVAGLIAAPAWAARGDEQGRRDSSLDPCDAYWDAGHRGEARRCYGALAASSDSLAVRAEVYWALGDLKRADSDILPYHFSNRS